MSEVNENIPDVDRLTEGLSNLSVEKKVEIPGEPVPAQTKKGADAEDDGYLSSTSDENATRNDKVKKEEEAESDTKSDEPDVDDEEELKPLSFIPDPLPAPEILFISRGPVPIDQEGHRYTPYGRNQSSSGTNHIAPTIPQLVEHVDFDPDSNSHQPKPNIMILRKADTKNPSKLDATVTWSNKHEICIDRHQLPDETYYGEEALGNKVQLFIQLNPSIKELKSFLADVKTEIDGNGQRKVSFIGPIVISLKTELADSQEKYLLEKTTMEERTAAFNLVNQKEMSQLTSGIGPHKDTVLSVLCAQRNPANPGQTYAQIHAVIQRLITHGDKKVKQTVFKLNNNQISAFEIAAITNNSVVACYLAEIMYNLTDDTRTALRILNCKDTQGNTIIHLLARKGDSNHMTMKALLDMRLTDGTKVFNIISNSKKQFPMHIATQNVKNQPETICILYQSMPRSFEVMDDDGMTALHYACQRTTDVELVRTVLSHKKDNINVRTKDGMTALDLISVRTRVTTQTQGMFAIEIKQQEEIVQLIRNNGGKSGSMPTADHIVEHMNGTHNGMMDYSAQNMGYPVHSTGSMASSSPPHSVSPMGSPYSYQNSNITSPRTPSVGSPVSISNPSMNSVGSYQQSSPESVNIGSPHYQSSPHYQGSPYNNPESPVSVHSHLSYEDQIASQILTQFPEITNVLGQILDQNNH
eukprot:TRINITY_DN5094_c0_g1_i2.p1 TRINITY_DN5094_c0_g1~~TRINITY_DN5094_c0_g1_i2.p1  ORF type:complete len:721 (-),score=171.28 TRINITY_DN5094_c0_g1_i2:583-2673(-)